MVRKVVVQSNREVERELGRMAGPLADTYSRESKGLEENGDGPLVLVGSVCLILLAFFLLFFLCKYLRGRYKLDRATLVLKVSSDLFPLDY